MTGRNDYTPETHRRGKWQGQTRGDRKVKRERWNKISGCGLFLVLRWTGVGGTNEKERGKSSPAESNGVLYDLHCGHGFGQERGGEEYLVRSSSGRDN